MLPLPNENERLKEKLARQAAKRGADSPAAEELRRLEHPAGVETPERETREKGTVKK